MGDIHNNEYKSLREKVLDIPELKELMPGFIKANRSSEDFFRYMQTQSEHYKGRREIITSAFSKMTQFIEFGHDEFDNTILGIKDRKHFELIGQGGFGSVYKYHNDDLNMDFAIKVYNPAFVIDDKDKEAGEKRFFREAKMLMSLNDEHIVHVYDAGRLNDSPCIKMEFVNGCTLEKIRSQYPNMSFKDAARGVIQILTGLKAAHKLGIIHRYLKPSNIMVETNGKKFICKIIDFGISAFMDTEGYTKLTKTGEHIAGSRYTDPQLDVEPSLRDQRSDIYSVGAILYYLLCGRTPNGGEVEYYLRASRPDITDKQIKTIMKSISIEITNRYNDCQEMIDALKAVS